MACVDLPAFPLQQLLRCNEEWRSDPVVVLAEDRPQSVVLWGNEHARRHAILPGMRYAQALSLAHDLRAGVVATEDISDAVTGVVDTLRAFSPAIEPARDEPGVFWLDAAGLGRLYPTVGRWAQAIRSALRARGWSSTVVVGFSRFGSYAVARDSARAITVLRDRDAERAAAARVPLDRLGIEPRLRALLKSV